VSCPRLSDLYRLLHHLDADVLTYLANGKLDFQPNMLLGSAEQSADDSQQECGVELLPSFDESAGVIVPALWSDIG